jgi:hypothetical protein
MEGGGSNLETARRRTTLTRSQGGTWGSMRSPRSLGGSGQTHHSEINCASGWEGRRLRTTTRRTDPEGREGGTWGQTSSLTSSDSGSVYLPVQEEHSVSEAKVHLPPEIGPAILPFWNTTPGASSSSSSSPGTSSSSKRKRKSETTSTITVQKMIMSIEAASKPRKEAEESSNFKEEKKKEDQQRERRNNHEEEDQDQKLDSTVSRTMGAYLQGSGPQTGQGSAPASSSSESLGSNRRSSSSSAGPANGSGCLHVWQVQE